MSLLPYPPSPFDHIEQSMRRAFNQLFDDDFYSLRSVYPYNWRDVPNERSRNIGSALGGVENTAEKFAVSLDVSHFMPEEIKVNLLGNELTIDGYHEEKSDQHGSIKRSFTRKYFLPADTDVDGVRSSLDDDGHLKVEVPKKTAALTQGRAIPITQGPNAYGRSISPA